MKALFAALSFLSLLPVPKSWTGESVELSRSVGFFPLAGLIMGAILALFGWALGLVMPRLAVAGVVVVGLAILTRGLHIDGLADTADGFWSNADRERMLEIMKDSHVGAMGAIAIVAVLLLKYSALAAVEGEDLWRGILLLVVTGRCMMVLPLSLFSYARKEGGMGRLFFEKRRFLNATWAVLAGLIAGWFLIGTAGLAAVVAAVVSTLAFCLYCKWKIGGVTGDTIGATCEIAEVATALTIAATVTA